MSQITIDKLMSVPTRQDLERTFLKVLGLSGFPVETWGKFSWRRAMVGLYAEALRYVWAAVVEYARGGFLSTANDDYITIVAKEWFGLERREAVNTRGNFTISCQAGLGPETWGPGELIAQVGNVVFRNLAEVTVGDGETTTVLLQAEIAGVSGNVPAGSKVELVTDVPGITLVLPPGWVTVDGLDRETAVELAQRCVARWGQIECGTDRYYETKSREAHPAIARVGVRESTPGPGEVTIVLASAIGTVSNAILDEVGLKLARPQCVYLWIRAADERVVNLQGTLYVPTQKLPYVRANIDATLTKLASEVPIGGVLYMTEALQRIHALGCRNVSLANATGTVNLGPNEVLVFMASTNPASNLVFQGV